VTVRGTAHRITDDERAAGKRAAKNAFARAVAACGYSSLDEVADLLGLSRARVRKMLSTLREDLDVVPSAADVILADHELGERFIRELRVERLALHGPTPEPVTLEQAAMHASAADARVQMRIASACVDGVIDGSERREIEAEVAESERARAPFIAMLRGGR
jgi:hypothetical protein